MNLNSSEQITVDILSEMGHEDLKQIGITAFGHRHKLIKGLEKLMSGNGEFSFSIDQALGVFD